MNEQHNEDQRATDRSDRVWTYQEITLFVDQAEEALSDIGIRFHPNSTLGVLFKQTRALSTNWETNRTDDGGLKRLIDANHANRIAQAIVAVKGDPNARNCLLRVAKNNMDLSEREISQGKDALWEIELLANLRRHDINAALIDPPDIVANFGFGDYSIACKKVYSHNSVENQVRRACQQIESSRRPGMVAINLDDLAPAQVFLTMKNVSSAMNLLAQFIKEFIDQHRQKLEKFLERSRCDGVFFSISVPVDIEQAAPRFNNVVQMLVWSVESATPQTKRRLAEVREKFSDIEF